MKPMPNAAPSSPKRAARFSPREEKELHHCERRPEDAERRRRPGHVAALDAEDELREDWDDHAERDHVEQDCDEDEDEGGALTADHREILDLSRGPVA